MTSPYIKIKATILFMVAFVIFSCKPPVKRPEVITPRKNYFQMGEALYKRGNLLEAYRYYSLYLGKHPEGSDAPWALMRMGEIKYSQGAYQDAIPLFKELIRKYSGSEFIPDAMFKLSDSYKRINRPDKALEVSRVWLKKYPHHPLKDKIIKITISSLLKKGLITDAISEASKAIEDTEISNKSKDEIFQMLLPLIDSATLDDLLKMKKIALKGPFYPAISYRIAIQYFRVRRFLKSKEEIDSLINTTGDENWISKARGLLNRIESLFLNEKRKIGCLLPLSGKASVFGREVLNGILLAMYQSNGNQLPEVIILDTAGDIETTKHAIRKLINDPDVKVIIGPLLSRTSTIAAEIAQSSRIPIITFTHKEGITFMGDMVYRNFLTPEKEITAVVNKAINEMGIKRFAILYPDTKYGHIYMNLFTEKVQELGGEISSIELYTSDETDFTAHIKNITGMADSIDENKELIKELRALMAEDEIDQSLFSAQEPFPIVNFEGIFIPDEGTKVALIIPQFPFMNVSDICYLGTEAWFSPQLPSNAGDYMELSLFPAPFFPENFSPEIHEYVTQYRINFNSTPGVLSATGYETTKMLTRIMNEKLVISRDDMNQALIEFQGMNGLTGFIRFDSNGEVTKTPLLLTVKRKRFALFEPQ